MKLKLVNIDEKKRRMQVCEDTTEGLQFFLLNFENELKPNTRAVGGSLRRRQGIYFLKMYSKKKIFILS